MKKIYLFCMAGLSTSMMVKKMQEAAKEEGYDCEIAAYSVSDVAQKGKDADCILLGPQVRYKLKEVQQQMAGKPVILMDMADYGMLRGKNVLHTARKAMGD